MKKTNGKRIALLAVTVLMCVAAVFTLATSAARVGSLDEANRLLEQVKKVDIGEDSAAACEEMSSAIFNLRSYILRMPLDESESGYNEFAFEYGKEQFRYAELIMKVFDEAKEKTDASGNPAPDVPVMQSALDDMFVLLSADDFMIDRALVYTEGEDGVYSADYDALNEKYAEAPFGCVEAMLDNLPNEADMAAALTNAAAFIERNGININDASNKTIKEKLLNARLACANGLLDAVADDAAGIDAQKNGVALRKLSAFIKANPLGKDETEGSDYMTFMAAYEQRIEVQNEALRAAREALTSKASFGDHYAGVLFFKGTAFAVGNQSINYADVDSGADGDNEYFTVRYENTKVTHTHISTASVPDNSRGVVVEFDFTTFGDMPSGSVIIERGSYTFPDGQTSGVEFFKINKDGVTIGNTTVAGLVQPGEWTHFTLIIDPDCNATLYVDYVLVGSVSLKVRNYVFEIDTIRMGAQAASGEFSIDNYMAYTGTSIRDCDYLAQLRADTEAYFVRLYQGLKHRLTDHRVLLNIYDECAALVNEFTPETEEGIAAVEAFRAMSRSDVQDKALENAREKLAEKITAIKDKPRDSSTSKERIAMLSNLDKFLAYNEGIMSETENDELYVAIQKIKKQLDDEDFVALLVTAVNDFFAESDAFKIKAKYDMAKKYITEAESDEEIMAMRRLSGFASFSVAYERFKTEGPTHYGDLVSIDNTEIFVSMMKYVASLISDPDWKTKHYDEIDKYIMLASERVEDGAYDELYSGFSEAYEVYLEYAHYFFLERQPGYITELRGLLDKCIAAVHPVEKAGVLAYIGDYIDNTDLDFENSEIIALVDEYEELLATLDGADGAYEELRTEYTEKFIEAVALIAEAEGYAARRALADEARVYYTHINRTGDGVLAAEAEYLEIEAALGAVEAVAKRFISEYALLASARTNEERFAALVTLSALYAEGIETEVAGAAAAIDGYNSAIDDMNEFINKNNGELDELLRASLAALVKAK